MKNINLSYNFKFLARLKLPLRHTTSFQPMRAHSIHSQLGDMTFLRNVFLISCPQNLLHKRRRILLKSRSCWFPHQSWSVYRQDESTPCNLPLIQRSFLLGRPSLPRNYPQEVCESRLFLCTLGVECTSEEGQSSQDLSWDGHRNRRQIETFLVNQNVLLICRQSRSVQMKNGIHLTSSELGNQLVRFIRSDE
jgi:hypothetical protein